MQIVGVGGRPSYVSTGYIYMAFVRIVKNTYDTIGHVRDAAGVRDSLRGHFRAEITLYDLEQMNSEES